MEKAKKKQQQRKRMQRGEKSDFSSADKLKNENDKLKREVARLRKQIKEFEALVKHYESFKAYTKTKRIEDKAKKAKLKREESKKANSCPECDEGELSKVIVSRADGEFYINVCDTCNYKSKLKRV